MDTGGNHMITRLTLVRGPAPAILVTGASSGIGRACALALDAHGFQVFAGVRKDADAAALQHDASDRLTPVFLDVTDAASIAAAVERIAQATAQAGLAGLVNNAGVTIPGPLEYLSLENFRQQLEINLIGQLAVTQACLPLIRVARGRIVTISSVAGRLTMPFNGAYSAAKHALEALCDTLRLELAPWGIQVSLVQPGNIATSMGEKLLHDTDAAVDALPPQGRARYGPDFQQLATMMTEHAQHGAAPAVVVAAVLHALTAPKARTRYAVGSKSRQMLTLARLLPDRLMDHIILRFFGLPHAASAEG
jgi:NAD(P)-dependent dehydrogenase (short-subunit alcohol dehydrogenase family)